MIQISMVSPVTGQTNTRDINCTLEQYQAWRAGAGYIQAVMPQVSADDREFLLSGCTPEDWDELFDADPEQEDWDELFGTGPE
jgi:hypothetical protein